MFSLADCNDGSCGYKLQKAKAKYMKQKMFCLYLRLSHHMGKDCGISPDTFMCEQKVWQEVTEFAAESGCNSVLIDVCDGLKYQRRPEISLPDAWSREALKNELARMRSLGLTPYPKVNFSTCHDPWLGMYNRMVSTPVYYEVCRDIIHELYEVFDAPEYIHLGMDEETWLNQYQNQFVSYRQFDLYWHDMKFLLDTVKEAGAKPWIWADSYWNDPEAFCKTVPKDTLVSPWYYQVFYDNYPFQKKPMGEGPERERASYKTLPENGYDIIPGASNYENQSNVGETLRFMQENCLPEHNRGLLLTPWTLNRESGKYHIMDCIQQGNDAVEKYGL